MSRFVLPRRTVLRGVTSGVAVQVALPALQAMLNGNGTALAQGQPLPKRFVVWYWGDGVRLAHWIPSATGPNWPLSEELASMAKVKSYLNVVSGTNVKFEFGNLHPAGHLGMLCAGAYLGSGSGSWAAPGPSMDQVVASAIPTAPGGFKSLQVGVLRRNSPEGSGVLYCSHNGPNSPNPPEFDAAKLFSRLFDGFTPRPSTSTPVASMPVVDVSLKLRKSVLDAVMTDITSLKQRVGTADARRLDEHTDNIRGLEGRLTTAPTSVPTGPGCRKPDAPAPTAAPASEDQYAAVNKTMSDLVALALACDRTRVISYQYAGMGNHNPYPGAGAGDHHSLCHFEGGDQPGVHKVSSFIMTQISVFLETLMNTPDGAGNLLDNSAVFCCSELAEGHSHSVRNQPIIVAGRGGGALKYPGVHYHGSGESSSIPALSAMRAAGAALKSWGSGPAQTDTGLSAIET